MKKKGAVSQRELEAMFLELMSYDCGSSGMNGVRIGWQDEKHGRKIIDKAIALRARLLAYPGR